MCASVWTGLIITVVCLVELATSESIVTPPESSTILSNGSISLECGLDSPYTGYFDWKSYSAATPVGGQLIYALSPEYAPNNKLPPGKYTRSGQYGLNVSSLNWKNGVMFGCAYLTADLSASASILVIDSLEARIVPDTSITVNTTVELTCIVTFGAMQFDDITDPQFPQLEMTLGAGQVFDEVAVPIQYEPGKPGVKIHTITRTINYTVLPSDVDKMLTCVVSTRKPEFSHSVNTTLDVQAAAHDVTVGVLQSVYKVGDIINCSAKGRPTPRVNWQPISANGRPTTGPTLNITADMIGPNVWKCIAISDGIVGSLPAALEVSFNVTAAVIDTPASETSAGQQAKVGLAVGLTLGLLAILGLAALIVFLIIRRRKNQDTRKKNGAPFIYTNVNNEAAAFKPRPIYKSGPHSTPPPLHDTSIDGANNPHDRSGYGDLGLGGFSPRAGSMSDPLANETTAPLVLDTSRQQEPTARNYGRPASQAAKPEPVFTDGWKPRDNYSNIPPPPLSVGSRSASNSALDQGSTTTPATAMGFADLGFTGNPALKASVNSLTRAANSEAAEPRPARHNRSIDHSIDSGSSSRPSEAGAGHRPPRNAVRGSNPLLNKSDDMAAGSDVDNHSSHSTAAAAAAGGGKGRMGRPPVPPPKKPDVVAVPQDGDDIGTVV